MHHIPHLSDVQVIAVVLLKGLERSQSMLLCQSRWSCSAAVELEEVDLVLYDLLIGHVVEHVHLILQGLDILCHVAAQSLPESQLKMRL